MTQRVGGSAPWLFAALVVAVAIVLLWGVQTGSCPSGISGDAGCTSGPVVGVAGAWVLTITGGLFVIYAIGRGYRALPSAASWSKV